MKVTCMNKICPHYQVSREVTFPVVGDDLFLTGGLMCVCYQIPLWTPDYKREKDAES